jgi:hypothetical protein
MCIPTKQSLKARMIFRSLGKVSIVSRLQDRPHFLFGRQLRGKILTHDNLIKRGNSLVSWCCMCQWSGETVDHLLLQYDIASELWNVVFTAFGIHWAMPLGGATSLESVRRLYGILCRYA